MSKVIYFTNAVSQTTFKEYLSNWRVSPNLSNQNFHNKLIKAVSSQDKVEVISIRPINKNYVSNKLPQLVENEYNISWRYPKVSTNKISKILFLNKRIKDVLSNINKDDVILVDTLNLSLLKSAVSLAKRKHIKIFGICTDNPFNISFTSNYYKNKLIKLGRSLDGYIVLTKAINDLYNVKNKPYIQIDGVSEEYIDNSKPLIKDKYIYFGGSLMEEYGVYSLIEAYKSINPKDIKLVLCGHHVNIDQLNKAIKDNKNIIFLGAVNYEDNLNLIKHSLFSVNPRPINPKIDEYSIPSKTLECLSLGVINITVDNPLLKEHYKDYIIWSKSSSKEDLIAAINKALNLSKEEKDKLTKQAKEIVLQRTSLEEIGKRIHELIKCPN